MITYKNPITIRGGHWTCPLPLALESYWACEADCLHCVGRRLNKIWGTEQRCTNSDNVEKILKNALLNKTPKTIQSQALHNKKAFFLGRKADPYQPIEKEKKITQKLIQILIQLNWPVVICSKYQSIAERDTDLFLKGRELIHMLIEITPGVESDWELFEHKRTSEIKDRLQISKYWQKLGIKVGVRGEPFIPGYHTIKQFRDILKRLKSYNLKSYNIYNLHMNEYTMKRLYNIGLDIEKIWDFNQDCHWSFLQKKLCQIAKEENIELGCPDFVNVPINWTSNVNTCCGINVTNAFTFNTHNWRNSIVNGKSSIETLNESWEGIGTIEDKKQANIIITGKPSKDFYTMKNAGII
jgi:DNA repair photolyase